jgi:predicted amino acid dehydrogenase
MVSDEKDKLSALKEAILHLNPIEVIIEDDISNAVKNADIVINATDSSEIEFEIEDLKPNATVCDISLSDSPFKKLKLRKDITFIRCGLVKLPYPVKLAINTGLPKGIILASLAETMLLTFEEKFVNYSLGDNINLDKLEEIADIATRYGFEVWVPEAPMI